MLEIINVVECNTRVCMHGLLSGQFLPPPHGLVAIDRIEFNQVCLPLRPLACDEGSAAPAKAVDNEIATARTVPNGIGYKCDWFYGRVHAEFIESLGPKRVRSGIGPNVAAIAAMPAKLDVVQVPSATVLPGKNQLVLAPVKGAHPGVGLRPNNEILKFAINPPTGGEHLVKMSPVRAYEMNRAISRMLGKKPQGILQKFRKLRAGFFTAGLEEFAMLDAALARGVTADFDIVGRIDKNQLCQFPG